MASHLTDRPDHHCIMLPHSGNSSSSSSSFFYSITFVRYLQLLITLQITGCIRVNEGHLPVVEYFLCTFTSVKNLSTSSSSMVS